MRLSISNIAWNSNLDVEILNILKELHINSIDIAPSKYFPNYIDIKTNKFTEISHWWLDRGVKIEGMQSLLFGTTGLNMFGDSGTQQKMLHHLSQICKIANALNCRKLVFGSPRNRDRSEIKDDNLAFNIAINFFKDLGDIASDHGVIFCLESNPECYGSNFMTSHRETALIVKYVSSSSIKMQLDLGALSIAKEDIEKCSTIYKNIIGHIHISEPNLDPIGTHQINHSYYGDVLKKYLPDSTATVEMLAMHKSKPIKTIKKSLQTAKLYYESFL